MDQAWDVTCEGIFGAAVSEYADEGGEALLYLATAHALEQSRLDAAAGDFVGRELREQRHAQKCPEQLKWATLSQRSFSSGSRT